MDACAFEGIAIGRSQAVAGFGEFGSTAGGSAEA